MPRRALDTAIVHKPRPETVKRRYVGRDAAGMAPANGRQCWTGDAGDLGKVVL